MALRVRAMTSLSAWNSASSSGAEVKVSVLPSKASWLIGTRYVVSPRETSTSVTRLSAEFRMNPAKRVPPRETGVSAETGRAGAAIGGISRAKARMLFAET
jgi:hypothetical protein